jgi:enolase-phosphatase E1
VIEVHGVRAVVTDIEGTTSSLAFVKDVLFPYARRALPDFVRGHQAQLEDIASDMAAIVGKPLSDPQQMIDLLLQWMAEDRKITPLKTLQGMVWKTGYESGELQSHLYEDAARSLRKWHADGLQLYVYSSGSVAAQKLLFAHTPYGDLLPLFSGYFDTTTGPKLESRSYQAITVALGLTPQAIVFLSDHAGEIQAANAAGLQTVLLARERTEVSPHFARSFDDIQLRCSREN